jgi:hypothetical protein
LDKVPVTSFDSVSQVDVWTASAVRVGNQKLLEDCIDLPLALTNNLSIEAANDTYVGPGYEHSGEGPNTLSMDTPTHLTLPLPTE